MRSTLNNSINLDYINLSYSFEKHAIHSATMCNRPKILCRIR